MTKRPLVGIVCCTRLIGEQPAQAVINRYLEATVRHADCGALLIPARPDLMDAAEAADRIDGLLLTGSPSNLQPNRYRVPDAAGEGPFDPLRDGMSLALIEAMIGRGRPILGICRGFQEINVAFGGTLARDLGTPGRDLPHHTGTEATLNGMFAHRHDVTLASEGVLAAALGRDRMTVTSVHFQGVERLGQGLSVEAVAEDGVIEAVSASVGESTLLGVQWHPEWETESDPASIGIFNLFGRVLRGEKALGRGLAG